MNNPIPPATHEFSAETVSMAEIRPLAVRLLNETRLITPSGASAAGKSVPLHVVASVDGFEVTKHNYGDERVLECECGKVACKHLEALEVELDH